MQVKAEEVINHEEVTKPEEVTKVEETHTTVEVTVEEILILENQRSNKIQELQDQQLAGCAVTVESSDMIGTNVVF